MVFAITESTFPELVISVGVTTVTKLPFNNYILQIKQHIIFILHFICWSPATRGSRHSRREETKFQNKFLQEVYKRSSYLPNKFHIIFKNFWWPLLLSFTTFSTFYPPCRKVEPNFQTYTKFSKSGQVKYRLIEVEIRTQLTQL